MALSNVQHQAGSNNFGGTTAATAFPSNVVSGDLVIAVAIWNVNTGGSNCTLQSFTDGRNTYTLGTVHQQLVTTNYQQVAVQIGYAIAGASEALTVTANWDNSTSGGFCSVYELSTGAFDQQTGATGNSTDPSAGTLAGVPAGSLGIVGCIMDDGTGSSGIFVAGSGWTIDLNEGGGSQSGGTEYATANISGSVTGDFTSSGSTGKWAAAVMTFSPSGGAGDLSALIGEPITGSSLIN